jgi:hypothetical protein
MPTPRNGDAQARLRAHLSARDCGEQTAADEGLGEHIASFSAQYKVRITPEGAIHVYRPRQRTTNDDRISAGVDDPAFDETELARQSRRIAKINKDNAEFWARREGIPRQ